MNTKVKISCVVTMQLISASMFLLYEPYREKTGLLHMRKQRRRSAKLISAFVFATWIVQSLYLLKPKFQASSYLLWLYNLVCVGPGRKPRRPVFSERGSYGMIFLFPKSEISAFYYCTFVFDLVIALEDTCLSRCGSN